ncbi:MAG: methylenetetrahydrofolate reductase [NAD(P)H] [Candidatus Eremiobacteraeota bacterium]|nr:methylenetetrahydrofolate reductase [NAD(P)H] [Candidatus Eremiobacteraeota bacterium]MBV8375352.1 methylenetetrahydrofolate reductase [NAD(P)H] [Candidatus Eremiobacteraeota bacterium]
MRISDALATTRPFFSFEFFPPKDDDGSRQLFEAISALQPLRPAFVSITYGAGGSTRARTVSLAKQIQQEIGLTVVAHVTCVGASRAELRSLFDELARAGIENVLALRGDPPKGESAFVAPSGGFAHASELVAMLRRNYDFCIGAACYPEKHPEAPNFDTDLEHLRRKIEAGADFLVSQLFFDNDAYFEFERRARNVGILTPILPGLMPITNFEQIKRFVAMCGAVIPPKLHVEMELRKGDPEAVEALGVAYASMQAIALLHSGVPGIHFYTLNKSPATRAIVSSILAASAWRPATSVKQVHTKVAIR